MRKPFLIAVLLLSSLIQAQEKAGPPNLYPDANLTPGEAVSVSTGVLCVPGYSKTVRNVPDSEKKEVFKRYRIPWADHSKYEVDHFVSLELGGTNQIENLWPQIYLPKPGAREKDVSENFLHWQVCHGKMSLEEAQTAIRQDWYAVYLKRSAVTNGK